MVILLDINWFFPCRVFVVKFFWGRGSSQNYYTLALFHSLHIQLPFEMYLAVVKHNIIVKYCQFKYNYH